MSVTAAPARTLERYRLMRLIREFETEAERQYKLARIGGYCHLSSGQEAATVGSFGALTVPIGAEIASHVGAQPLRLIFAAFLITTVGWGLLHTQRRKPAAAPGPGSATSIQPGAGNTRPARPAIAAAPGAGGPLPTTTGRSGSTFTQALTSPRLRRADLGIPGFPPDVEFL